MGGGDAHESDLPLLFSMFFSPHRPVSRRPYRASAGSRASSSRLCLRTAAALAATGSECKVFLMKRVCASSASKQDPRFTARCSATSPCRAGRWAVGLFVDAAAGGRAGEVRVRFRMISDQGASEGRPLALLVGSSAEKKKKLQKGEITAVGVWTRAAVSAGRKRPVCLAGPLLVVMTRSIFLVQVFFRYPIWCEFVCDTIQKQVPLFVVGRMYVFYAKRRCRK